MVRMSDSISARRRLDVFKWLVLVLGAILMVRLVDLQLVKHNEYLAQAADEHTRKYQIPAKRGELYLYDRGNVIPVVLNQTLQLMYADPRFVTDREATAKKIAGVTGARPDDYVKRMNAGIEYAVLERRLTGDAVKRIKELGLKGIGFTPQDYRNYPESQLAAQVLGFVNAAGVGQYGVEGFLNEQLSGKPGQLAAKTDTRGIPIATADNIVKSPQNGTSYVLTIDRNVQAMAEQELAEQITKVKAKSGSIVVMDPSTGAVVAMANYPTYDPANFSSVNDYSVFVNQAVSSQFEPGSGMKAFTVGAGLDQGKITPQTTFNDTGSVKVGDRVINNAEGDRPGNNKSMTVALRDSLNTGMVFILKQLGDGTNITSGAKKTLYNYFTKHFGFGTRTGIEQTSEASGFMPGPSTNDVTYANVTFGQGMSATMIQMVAAMGAVANGGTLYQPRVVDGEYQADGSIKRYSPKVISRHVLSPEAIKELNEMLQVVVQRGSGYIAGSMNPGYKIAGKTGTAQIPRPDGKGYIDGANIGSFVGFAPADNPRFVVMVRINEPGVKGFAEVTTVPVFGDMCRWLFKYYGIAPSS